MPRVALATCAALPALDPDDQPLVPALRQRGIDARPEVWSDTSVEWTAYDLVVVRSTWDYARQRDAFLAWARQLPRLLNPVEVLEWNTDKSYLGELASAGLPVVPTRWLHPGDRVVLPAGEYVVKPAVSAGAKDTARYGPGDEATAMTHVERLLAERRTVMVQPYLAEVDLAGETALIYLGGTYSHAIRKGPLLRRGATLTRGLYAEETITGREPQPSERALADRVLAGVPDRSRLGFARVDVVPGPDGTPVLLELELTEPSLFLTHHRPAVERFAEVVAQQVLTGPPPAQSSSVAAR